MTPLDLLWSALAFLAGILGLWMLVCFVIAGVVLFKPRGRMHRAESVADAVKRVEAGVKRSHSGDQGGESFAKVVDLPAQGWISGLESGVGQVNEVVQGLGDLAHEPMVGERRS